MTPGDIRRQAAELAALEPEHHPGPWCRDRRTVAAATRTVPIVFPSVGDPVAAGLMTFWRGPVATPRAFSRSNTA